jgi:hypothetical protein
LRAVAGLPPAVNRASSSASWMSLRRHSLQRSRP